MGSHTPRTCHRVAALYFPTFAGISRVLGLIVIRQTTSHKEVNIPRYLSGTEVFPDRRDRKGATVQCIKSATERICIKRDYFTVWRAK